jgi:hypothetical protein
MPQAQKWHLLPPDLIELQIGQIDLLMAMYPDDFVLDPSSENLLSSLRDDCYSEHATNEATTITTRLHLPISISDEPNALEAKTLVLDLPFLFTHEGLDIPENSPHVKVRIQQPFWLSRAATSQLATKIPEGEDLLGAIEYIKETAAQILEKEINDSNTSTIGAPRDRTAPLVRVWFYFPSISTRSKRDDFIIHAPSYALTGFLYAGKPGLLCVEGASTDIDDYMKFIKTESWGDIPAHHKKVSERYRETGDKIERAFPSMTEITDTVGERRGQRANRGDMKAMEEWLVERGLGEAFTKVLM